MTCRGTCSSMHPWSEYPIINAETAQSCRKGGVIGLLTGSILFCAGQLIQMHNNTDSTMSRNETQTLSRNERWKHTELTLKDTLHRFRTRLHNTKLFALHDRNQQQQQQQLCNMHDEDEDEAEADLDSDDAGNSEDDENSEDNENSDDEEEEQHD